MQKEIIRLAEQSARLMIELECQSQRLEQILATIRTEAYEVYGCVDSDFRRLVDDAVIAIGNKS